MGIVDKIINTGQKLNVQYFDLNDLIITKLDKYQIIFVNGQKGGLITKWYKGRMRYYYYVWGDFNQFFYDGRFSEVSYKAQKSVLRDVMMYKVLVPQNVIKNLISKDWKAFKGVEANRDNLEILDMIKSRLIKSFKYYGLLED